MIAKRQLSYSAVVFVFCGGPIPPAPFPTRKGVAKAVPHFLSGRGARGVGLAPNSSTASKRRRNSRMKIWHVALVAVMLDQLKNRAR